MWLLDRDALGGEDHRTTLHTTPLICNDAQAFDAKGVWGALGAWQDEAGHAVGAGAVLGTGEHDSSRRRSSTRGRRAAAWRPSSSRSAPASGSSRPRGCRATWIWRRKRSSPTASCSRMRPAKTRPRSMPDAAWNEPGGPRLRRRPQLGSRSRRIPTSRRAALYALDGQTGKELWSSGNQIESWNHFSGLTVANGRAYIATFDGGCIASGVAVRREARDARVNV